MRGYQRMPIYEYRCEKCGNQIEIIQKFSDKPLKSCPSCKGKLAKLISQTAFQLKGSGWYVTDYARKSESKSEKPSEPKNGDKAKPASETPAKSETAKTTPDTTPKK
jgi:putative FmdB family regulatory protein